MLGQLPRQDQADSCLYLPGGDCGFLVVACQRCSLHGNLLENVSNERIQDGHCLRGDTGVWVNLLQDLQGKIGTVSWLPQRPFETRDGLGYTQRTL